MSIKNLARTRTESAGIFAIAREAISLAHAWDDAERGKANISTHTQVCVYLNYSTMQYNTGRDNK